MSDLAFPPSGYVLDFLRQTALLLPDARFDADELMRHFGISQRSNAGVAYRWLRESGFVSGESGRLTDRGEALLKDPASPEFRDANRAALNDLFGTAFIAKVLAQSPKPADLRLMIEKDFGVKRTSANKAAVGGAVLARNTGDGALIAAFGPPPATPPEARRAFEAIHGARVVELREAEHARELILEKFALFTGGTGGIDSWLGEDSPETTFERLARLDQEPLSLAQFRQLLALAHEAPLSAGFFRYYWLTTPSHVWNIAAVPGYDARWGGATAVLSQDHLAWGLYRFYVDALLFFGNIRTAYQQLRNLEYEQIDEFFLARRFDSDALAARGPFLPLDRIAKDDRYLIAEMACKSYEPADEEAIGLRRVLFDGLAEHLKTSTDPIQIRTILDGETSFAGVRHKDIQGQLVFSADDMLNVYVSNEDDLLRAFETIKIRFSKARELALKNTRKYLSMVGDLDVYVATSMRSSADFRSVADLCERVFETSPLSRFSVRYFDPTLSAATNHEDKGVIECLMVKRAKVLLYNAGPKDSYGKDAEAAMALSLGKPVIFFCDEAQRQNFYQEVHPLSRLVHFDTGVVVGAMVTDSEEEVATLMDRLFSNAMEYDLVQKAPGYLVLRERLTGSSVRLQTNDVLLRETFWNHYNSR
ncbi:MAG: hypothetical protein AB7G21_10290 [Dehalococcoidia bacterium]